LQKGKTEPYTIYKSQQKMNKRSERETWTHNSKKGT
jgi:hypothetical protein